MRNAIPIWRAPDAHAERMARFFLSGDGSLVVAVPSGGVVDAGSVESAEVSGDAGCDFGPESDEELSP
jgi:hypothetical protein